MSGPAAARACDCCWPATRPGHETTLNNLSVLSGRPVPGGLDVAGGRLRGLTSERRQGGIAGRAGDDVEAQARAARIDGFEEVLDQVCSSVAAGR